MIRQNTYMERDTLYRIARKAGSLCLVRQYYTFLYTAHYINIRIDHVTLFLLYYNNTQELITLVMLSVVVDY
jgi:hypothetical protein